MVSKLFAFALAGLSIALMVTGLVNMEWYAGFGLVGLATASLCGVAAYLGVQS
jgi:hypothetical protein